MSQPQLLPALTLQFALHDCGLDLVKRHAKPFGVETLVPGR